MIDKGFFRKHKTTLIYGISMAVLLLFLKWLELHFIILHHSFELYAGFIALIFMGLGIWLAGKLFPKKVKTVVVEKEVPIQEQNEFSCNTALVEELGLSKREMEILQLMAKGNSNQEIAETIFVSLSTVKTHNRNLFIKLSVKRRTQAVEKARRLHLIP